MTETKITFEAFTLSLATATLVALGEIENPMTKKKEKDPEAARQHIDILEMLSVKTKGNLTESEAKLMQDILYQMRMKFIGSSH